MARVKLPKPSKNGKSEIGLGKSNSSKSNETVSVSSSSLETPHNNDTAGAIKRRASSSPVGETSTTSSCRKHVQKITKKIPLITFDAKSLTCSNEVSSTPVITSILKIPAERTRKWIRFKKFSSASGKKVKFNDTIEYSKPFSPVTIESDKDDESSIDNSIHENDENLIDSSLHENDGNTNKNLIFGTGVDEGGNVIQENQENTKENVNHNNVENAIENFLYDYDENSTESLNYHNDENSGVAVICSYELLVFNDNSKSWEENKKQEDVNGTNAEILPTEIPKSQEKESLSLQYQHKDVLESTHNFETNGCKNKKIATVDENLKCVRRLLKGTASLENTSEISPEKVSTKESAISPQIETENLAEQDLQIENPKEKAAETLIFPGKELQKKTASLVGIAVQEETANILENVNPIRTKNPLKMSPEKGIFSLQTQLEDLLDKRDNFKVIDSRDKNKRIATDDKLMKTIISLEKRLQRGAGNFFEKVIQNETTSSKEEVPQKQSIIPPEKVSSKESAISPENDIRNSAEQDLLLENPKTPEKVSQKESVLFPEDIPRNQHEDLLERTSKFENRDSPDKNINNLKASEGVKTIFSSDKALQNEAASIVEQDGLIETSNSSAKLSSCETEKSSEEYLQIGNSKSPIKIMQNKSLSCPKEISQNQLEDSREGTDNLETTHSNDINTKSIEADNGVISLGKELQNETSSLVQIVETPSSSEYVNVSTMEKPPKEDLRKENPKSKEKETLFLQNQLEGLVERTDSFKILDSPDKETLTASDDTIPKTSISPEKGLQKETENLVLKNVFQKKTSSSEKKPQTKFKRSSKRMTKKETAISQMTASKRENPLKQDLSKETIVTIADKRVNTVVSPEKGLQKETASFKGKTVPNEAMTPSEKLNASETENLTPLCEENLQIGNPKSSKMIVQNDVLYCPGKISQNQLEDSQKGTNNFELKDCSDKNNKILKFDKKVKTVISPGKGLQKQTASCSEKVIQKEIILEKVAQKESKASPEVSKKESAISPRKLRKQQENLDNSENQKYMESILNHDIIDVEAHANARKYLHRKGKKRKIDVIEEPVPETLIEGTSDDRTANWIQSQTKFKYKKVRPQTYLKDESDDDEEDNVENSLVTLPHDKRETLKQIVSFACEWIKCEQEFDDENEFFDHFDEHMQQIDATNITDCPWDVCRHVTTTQHAMKCHIQFHAYHTALKTRGESLAIKAGFPRCSLNSMQRNTISSSVYDQECQWKHCTETFTAIHRLFQHVELHCQHQFRFRPVRNMVMERKQFVVVCQWFGCGKSFKSSYRMTEHMRTHTKEKIIACPHCGSMFANHTRYFDHCKRQLVNNSQEFLCTYCYKFFASERLLNDHITNHLNCIKCTKCDMTCSSKAALAKHIRNRHMSEKPLKCPDCDHRCIAMADLEHHRNHMHRQKRFYCQAFGCGYSCTTTCTLKEHQNEIHGNGSNVYECHLCEAQYKRGTPLSVHLKKMHGFRLPEGYTRFLYRPDADGIFRVQILRTEILEVTKQIMSPRPTVDIDPEEVQLKFDEIVKTDDCYKLNIDVRPKGDAPGTPEYCMEGDSSTVIKRIEEFAVMKNYLCRADREKENHVLITLQDTDSCGNVTKVQCIETSEIVMPDNS